MNLKSNRGVTLADISISIMIIFLFSSLITGLVYNYAVSSKAINRRTEATQYAITVIEDLKQIEYEKIDKLLDDTSQVESGNDLENDLIIWGDFDGKKVYNLSLKGYNQLLERNIELKNGYSVIFNLEKYSEESDNVIIMVTVGVEYTVGPNIQTVELSTLLVNEEENS